MNLIALGVLVIVALGVLLVVVGTIVSFSRTSEHSGRHHHRK